MLSFEELTNARRSLQDFCRLHVPSLWILNEGVSFRFDPDEPDSEFADGAVHNMTTTATCIASLHQCPPRFWPTDMGVFASLRKEFSRKALLRPDQPKDKDKWKSEDSAAIYCRCRALPMVIDGLPTGRIDPLIERHIKKILDQLEQQSDRFGIGEADTDEKKSDWYPANAFHTYWTLEILEIMQRKSSEDYDRLSAPDLLDLTRKRQGMVLWARQRLGYQIGLHSPTPQSSLLDSDQLAWSLAIYLRFDDLKVDLETRDFIKQAFACLFSTQFDGTWRHYKPLFHYKKVGNAYCYVFETFAALIQSALRSGIEGEMIRELLAPYCENLMNLWRHAYSTKIDLSRYTGLMQKRPNSTGKETGWCSGHRVNFTKPETWASASVFSYAQSLRRLVGIWCREEATGKLRTARTQLGPADALKEMHSRGETWAAGKVPVAERLQTMFINPVKRNSPDNGLEPDSQPITDVQARSAILFGPPGTSKTSLVRYLADAIEWTYVELHASHFVAQGLPNVQKTADLIFRQLLEMDHAVVLFDEIDELVRERGMEKDAFGRFLTTSMLPKLAQLWEAKKILYFVATNHITFFDSAIIRSQRFDALILVSPPSFAAKRKRLDDLLSRVYGLNGVGFEVTKDQVDRELKQIEQNKKDFLDAARLSGTEEPEELLIERWGETELHSGTALAKFALLRHDEMDELAYRLANSLKQSNSQSVSVSTLRQALEKIGDSQWRKNKAYADYLKDIGCERRDYKMLNVWEVKTTEEGIPGVQQENNRKWLSKTVNSSEEIEIPGFQVKPATPGCIEILRTVKLADAAVTPISSSH